jgi:hypothetical protein
VEYPAQLPKQDCGYPIRILLLTFTEFTMPEDEPCQPLYVKSIKFNVHSNLTVCSDESTGEALQKVAEDKRDHPRLVQAG